MTKIIAISGRIASGKTTIARALAATLGWKLAGFGDFVRQAAKDRGFKELNREVLQNVGQELVVTDTPSFCRKFLASVQFRPGDLLIVDGIRHLQVLRDIQAETKPSKIKLLHIEAHRDVRKERFARREPIDDFQRADNHEVERGTDLLRARADITIDTSDLSVQAAHEKAISWAQAAFG
jgi:dephospho-CoA kinase